MPFLSPLSGRKESEPVTGPLPPIFLALLPKLEWSCFVPALVPSLFSPDRDEALWDAFVRHTRRMRDAGVFEYDVEGVPTIDDLRVLILGVLQRGLEPIRARPRSAPRQVLGAFLPDLTSRALARRVLTGGRIGGKCRHYAYLFQALFRVAKRFKHLEGTWCIAISGRTGPGPTLHAWNWLMHSDDNRITTMDVHTAALGMGPGVSSVANDGLDASDAWNASAFAAHLLSAYSLEGPLKETVEVEAFFAALFGAAEVPAVLGCQIGLHGTVHPSVENRLLERLTGEQERDHWRERMRAGHLAVRFLMDPEAQSKLLAPALGRSP